MRFEKFLFDYLAAQLNVAWISEHGITLADDVEAMRFTNLMFSVSIFYHFSPSEFLEKMSSFLLLFKKSRCRSEAASART